jgi:tRNA(fMet)-specific endonuclease VapC
MRRFLLDTGIAGDFINRRRGIFERAQREVTRGNRVGIGIPVLAELVYGIEQSTSRDRNMQRLSTALAAWKVWPFDNKAAFKYGRIAAELKRIGRPMQQIDIQIAAIAFALGNCTVVSGDSDLKAVPGLSVEDWRAGEGGTAADVKSTHQE